MAYLKSKGLLDLSSEFWVEIAMDFYRDRAGAVGFHKDSLDLTIFVGLMFNNANVINGPEYFYDTAPDPVHQQNVKNKLPQKVLDDIAHFRSKMIAEKTIYRSELEQFGWIIFTDETVNHSSPTLDSRAILGKEDQEKLLAGLQKIPVEKDKLEIIKQYFASFDATQKFYPEDIMAIVGDATKDEKIALAFVALGKANLSIVTINDCAPQNRETHAALLPAVDNTRVLCAADLNPHASKVSADNKKLTRENSDKDLLLRVKSQPQSDAPRQFVRLWVQVTPKSAVTM
jgi:hypothetical protein